MWQVIPPSHLCEGVLQNQIYIGTQSTYFYLNVLSVALLGPRHIPRNTTCHFTLGISTSSIVLRRISQKLLFRTLKPVWLSRLTIVLPFSSIKLDHNFQLRLISTSTSLEPNRRKPGDALQFHLACSIGSHLFRKITRFLCEIIAPSSSQANIFWSWSPKSISLREICCKIAPSSTHLDLQPFLSPPEDKLDKLPWLNKPLPLTSS